MASVGVFALSALLLHGGCMTMGGGSSPTPRPTALPETPPPVPVAEPAPVPAPVPEAPSLPVTQERQLTNLQPLGFAYIPTSKELVLALYSVSGRTDPKILGNRENIHIKLLSPQGDEATVLANQLKMAVLGDMMSVKDRRFSMFRFTIVIDESGSVDNTSLRQAREIITEFITRLPRSYRAQIIRFATNVVVATPFTNDVAVLRRSLSGPRLAAKSYTAFYDAIDEAFKQLETGTEPLKFCVAFTDGKDNRSQRFGTDPAAQAEAFRAHVAELTQLRTVPLFLAGVGKEIDSALLKKVADESLGLYQPAAVVQEIKNLFDVVTAVVKATYVFTIPVPEGFESPRMIYIMQGPAGGNLELVQDIPIFEGRLR